MKDINFDSERRLLCNSQQVSQPAQALASTVFKNIFINMHQEEIYSTRDSTEPYLSQTFSNYISNHWSLNVYSTQFSLKQIILFVSFPF